MTSTSIWTTADGNQIKIADMETSHLQNVLIMLRRKYAVLCHDGAASEPNAFKRMKQEAEARTRIAEVYPIYAVLAAELKRRRVREAGAPAQAGAPVLRRIVLPGKQE